MLKYKDEVYTINVHITVKNIFINVSDKKGNTVIFLTSGGVGFDGKQKKNKIVVQAIIEKVIDKMKQKKISFVNIDLINTDKFTKQILRSLYTSRIIITRIREISSFAHGGCRPVNQKRR